MCKELSEDAMGGWGCLQVLIICRIQCREGVLTRKKVVILDMLQIVVCCRGGEQVASIAADARLWPGAAKHCRLFCLSVCCLLGRSTVTTGVLLHHAALTNVHIDCNYSVDINPIGFCAYK